MAKIKKQRIRFICVFLSLLCLAGNLPAHNYLWPTNASRNPTSFFAGFRSGYSYAGIDIKTWEREGYIVFTTRNGHIWKVRISLFGYGRVIYQMLDTGEMAIYVHL